MRLIPLITAMIVTGVMYMAVFEREALLAFARGEAADGQVSGQMDQPTSAQPDTMVAQSPSKKIGVVVLRSTAQTIDSAVVLRGQTKAARQVQVRSEISATVISEPLRKGAFVEQGDVLCRLDPGSRAARLAEAKARLSEARSRVPEAEARLDEARARLSEAKINWNAAEKLIKGGYTSQTRLKSTEANVAAARAAIKSAESGLESSQSGIEAAIAAVSAAQKDMERLVIHAPFRGLLESDTAELGSLMQPGALCATVIQLDPIKLVGYVPETDVDRVRIGARAGAELASGARVQGKVTFLPRSADPTTRTFEVEISVPNKDLKIRDGQTAAILIAADGAMAHRLSQSALTLNKDGQIGVRVVGKDNIVAFRPVELVRDDTDGIWVSGLGRTADVIVMGQDFVTAGVEVDPTYKEAIQ